MRFCNSGDTTRHYTAVGSQRKSTDTVGKKKLCLKKLFSKEKKKCHKQNWQSFICLLGKPFPNEQLPYLSCIQHNNNLGNNFH